MKPWLGTGAGTGGVTTGGVRRQSPDVIAAEIAENLGGALEQFEEIARELDGKGAR